jgi:sugar/nucleoside kinase (ribokinase family)
MRREGRRFGVIRKAIAVKKVLTIGEILVEIMAVEPGRGFREAISLVGPFPSGAPAIFIDQAARLGQPAAMIGCVGKDDFGAVCIERLKRDGVDVGAIGEDPDRPTGSAFVRYRPDGARDFVFNIRHSACGAVRATPQTDAAIAACDHLHVMGTSLFSDAIVELTLDAIKRVRARHGTISFDPNIRREMLDLPGLRKALDFVAGETDLFLPSGPELFLFTEAGSEAEAARALLDRGMKAIVVKRGAAGAGYFDAETALSVGAYPAQEIDPTGAGDCFAATFVSCWLRHMPPRRALAYANAAGSLAVRRKGPMEGASTLAEIEAVVAAAGAA